MDQRHPADSRNLSNTGLAPTRAPITRVRDVLIATTALSHEADDHDFDAHPPVTDEGAFDLGYSLRIDRLSDDDVELVMNACDPRGHYFIATRQYGQRYAYVFEPTEEQWQADRYRWDPDARINAALQLSRFVRDNVDSMEYAARLFEHADGERQVIPRHDCELGRAYRLHRGRDWMDRSDAASLRDLLDAYWRVHDELPDRVSRALRRATHIPTERYVEDRLVETVIALESLVNAGPARVSRQFKDRVHLLGQELAVDGVSKGFCRKMYEARSHGLHGADITLFKEQGPPISKAVEDVARLEETLRRAVRRALEDAEFQARFADVASVEAWCPIQMQDQSLLRGLYRRLLRGR